MKKSHLLGTMCACLLYVTVTPAIASVVYKYTGNNFTQNYNQSGPPIGYNPTGALSLSINLATPLGPNETRSSDDGTLDLVGFSYNDGVASRNSAWSFSIFLRSNDAGEIVSWGNIFVLTQFPLEGDVFGRWRSESFGRSIYDVTYTYVCTLSGNPCQSEALRSGSNFNNPGTWSVSQVPIPSAVWLFGSGLLGLIGMARRKKAA